MSDEEIELNDFNAPFNDINSAQENSRVQQEKKSLTFMESFHKGAMMETFETLTPEEYPEGFDRLFPDFHARLKKFGIPHGQERDYQKLLVAINSKKLDELDHEVIKRIAPPESDIFDQRKGEPKIEGGVHVFEDHFSVSGDDGSSKERD